ncbi:MULTISPECIES: potassium-transporting ATPase subunit KdpA [Clostridium]|jgi:K+-transporting ATPase ATPase A chain|uniref:Potassium-transporting ATPase potassium-binding subunit n=1 Tax=Clostridium tertium TaxID=1559 RepID=A0A9X4B2C1_9CLOT|nr:MULTISPECIES: potassium-transporting ATPase subunit KdpA [Clostridium]MBU6134124.1 potassium-transporting ATPase subunit KdpA [Clostridium tertium]MDB1939345.1 potassium-transporting ATPase subunit KdpA [Clostridium tertium]MDB1946438.1 potassium-transporting ATPase subunit KdpA [Clostridium tertium]MDC4240501.1 potassium-transporting ATPase subunit KdpA [Clostridium tertium]MDU1278185.1 potassium-transporting ATPase subunit KdpA [Clostridium sp.]
MINSIIQYSLYLIILVVLAIPLGKYIGKVMNGEKVFLSKILNPIENFIYKILRIDKDEEMDWKKYSVSIIAFSVIGFVILFLLQIVQGILPLNPEDIKGVTWDLSFNTTSSFVTNTNWQSYSGESQLSYLTQMLGLTVQNFVSAAVGIAVLFALIRGFTRVKGKTIGNFWVDATRSIIHILMPLSIVVSLLIASQGVVQNFSAYQEVELLQPITLEDGTVITKQVLPQGPAASQIAIKQLGTNGGGFFGVNSAHPLENPTPFSNAVEMISILLIPAALCFTFGRNIKDKRQGRAIFIAMFLMLVIALSVIAVNEANATPQLAQSGVVDVSTINQAGGNMEGKESRFGIASSSTWAAFTTAASNGSVNSMHDSYTPLGGMVTMLLMQLGEVVFGGVGCGLYGMLAFAIIAVFMAGLMVGRTPEYLGKKIEPFEMKMAMLVCLATPIATLIGSGIASVVPSVIDSLNNSGAHGFSEMLYAYSSAGGNNGSAFAGFSANTPFINVSIGLVMLFARFVPMIATLAIAGSLVKKKKVAVSAGTLPTHDALFIGLLVFVVLLVGALSFFPALALGPIAEFFQMIG